MASSHLLSKHKQSRSSVRESKITFSQLISSLFGSKNEAGRSKWLEQKLHSIAPRLRILDAGAGELKNKHLCEHLIYVSQDFCQYNGQGNKEGLQTGNWDTSKVDLVCDITEIPEPDASFDVILCSEVFEHIPDPLKALEEFFQSLNCMIRSELPKKL